MQWIILLLIFLAAISIFYQDIKSRSVVWFLFPLMGILGFFLSISEGKSIKSIVISTSINMSILVFQWLILMIYYCIREKQSSATMRQKIGLGDILFLLSSCFYFSPLNFILFYVLSLVFSILVHAGVILITNSSDHDSRKIPLAGFQALFLIVFICLSFVLSRSLVSDEAMINFIK